MDRQLEFRDVHFSVEVYARSGNQVGHLRLAGEVDLATGPKLAAAVQQLRAAGPSTVVIDLAGVTFADSTLANLVVRVRNALPAGVRLLLCQPSPMTRIVLETTSMDTIADLCDALPDSFGERPPTWFSRPETSLPGPGRRII